MEFRAAMIEIKHDQRGGRERGRERERKRERESRREREKVLVRKEVKRKGRGGHREMWLKALC